MLHCTTYFRRAEIQLVTLPDRSKKSSLLQKKSSTLPKLTLHQLIPWRQIQKRSFGKTFLTDFDSSSRANRIHGNYYLYPFCTACCESSSSRIPTSAAFFYWMVDGPRIPKYHYNEHPRTFNPLTVIIYWFNPWPQSIHPTPTTTSIEDPQTDSDCG